MCDVTGSTPLRRGQTGTVFVARKPDGTSYKMVLALSSVLSSGVSHIATAQELAGELSVPAIEGVEKVDFVDTSDLAIANAEEVIVDIPSAHFRPRFQRGEFNGLRYTVFPDGTAHLIRGERRQNLRTVISCKAGVSCEIKTADGNVIDVRATGAKKPLAPTTAEDEEFARYLAAWMLAGTGIPPKTEVVEEEMALEARSLTEVQTVQDAVEPIEQRISETQVQAEPSREAASQTPIGGDTEARAEATSQQEGACAEIGQFDPTSCAEPAEPDPPAVPVVRVVALPKAVPLRIEVPSEQPQPVETFAERTNLRCSLTGSVSLSANNRDAQSNGPGKPRTSLGCSGNITEKLTLRFSLIGYVKPEEQQNWDPDFTYAFNYRLSDKWNLSYSNYSGRFSGANGDFFEALGSGNLRASFKLPRLTLPNEKSIGCSASFGLPNPLDTSANISCGYAVTDKFRIGATGYIYAPGRQGGFDPDYSYSASYRFSDKWLLSYNNYSNNRWPWNRGSNPGLGVAGGSLSVSYSF